AQGRRGVREIPGAARLRAVAQGVGGALQVTVRGADARVDITDGIVARLGRSPKRGGSMAFRTRNPALRASVFEKYGTATAGEAMTVEGTVNKTAFLLFLAVVPAAWVWSQVTGAFDPRAASMPYILWGRLV